MVGGREKKIDILFLEEMQIIFLFRLLEVFNGRGKDKIVESQEKINSREYRRIVNILNGLIYM